MVRFVCQPRNNLCNFVYRYISGLKHSISIILCWLAFVCLSRPYAQVTDKDYIDKKKSKIKVVVSGGPEGNLIIPTDFGTRSDEFRQDTAFRFVPKISFRLGMNVRFDFTKRISFQTGLYYVSRTYEVNVGKTNGATPDIQEMLFKNSFKYMAFEIPMMALIYVQLGEKWFMNNAVGFTAEFFPSNTQKVDPYLEFEIYNARRSWIIPGVKAAVGFEFRTENAGYFYLGGQFHRPLIPISDGFVERNITGDIGFQTVKIPLSGTYFAIDFKYFLPLGKKEKDAKGYNW